MYYYAYINIDNGFCYDVMESETPMDDPSYVEVSGFSSLAEYCRYYPTRKTYENGAWRDTTVEEAEQMYSTIIAERAAIGGEWLTIILNNKADIDHTHDGYAASDHVHTSYASSDDLQVLEDMIDTKADASHTHSDYASSSHSHSEYATTVALDTLGEEVDGKADANHSHNEYSLITHNHDSDYAEVGHNHDTNYSPLGHSHSNYVTTIDFEALESEVDGKASSSHTHTAAEIGAATSVHNHDSEYSSINHSHDEDYAPLSHTHSNYATVTSVDELLTAVSGKANASTLTSHTGNTTVHITSAERTNWNVAKTHADSAHAPSNAEPNQNAFSNVVVGDVTISADTKTDTLTIVAGNNVTITPDSTGDSITISSANTVYTHPTSAGNKHIPAGGSSGQILRWSADGTAVWGNDNNTTYSNATQTASGLMSNTDKTKLDGIAEGANNYTLPSAGSALGGVKSGGDVTISGGIITVNDDSHNHVISNVDGLQDILDGKAASGHTHSDIYTETEVDTLLEGKANTSHSHTIANITNLQTTLDGKAATSHGTHVSYSTTTPVMDGTASVGTATTVARSDHKHPTDTSRAAQTSLDSHTGNKSNPHGVTLAQLGVTATAAELNYVDGVTSNVQTQLNGKAASGHTHGAATTSAAGFMTAAMVTKLNGIATGANAYSHPTYTARTGVPTANQTPAFGGTFTVSQPVSDGTGHITAVNSRTITIPSAVATTSANGLMSKSDKSKLDGMVLATVSEVETYLGI